MRSIFENIYFIMPIWLQNIAISAYGYKLDRIRYGSYYDQYYRDILSMDHVEKLNDYTLKKMNYIVKEAYENVPYYNELFRKYGIKYENMKSIEDLQKIPILEKDELRRNPSKFINQKYRNIKLIELHTTGTTGTPLNIYCTKKVRQLNYAFFNNFLQSVGINYKGKRATFWGRIFVSPKQRKPPFWRYSMFQKNLMFSSYHLKDDNIRYYIDKLQSYNPDYIDSYPSSIYIIAKYAQDHNIRLDNITKGITTSAETLFPWQRELIENIFGVTVYDQYGAAEMCVFVGQCRNGNYHIRTDYGIVEFIKENGTIASHGEEAELICTGFINPIMPLIRYRIGDMGVLSGCPCSCGSPFPVIESLLGRNDDVIITPDGRRIGRLSPVLKGFPVKEGQYIQKTLYQIFVRIVKDIGYTEKAEYMIANELRKRIGYDMSISFEYYDRIPRGPGGKLKTIVNDVIATRSNRTVL